MSARCLRYTGKYSSSSERTPTKSKTVHIQHVTAFRPHLPHQLPVNFGYAVDGTRPLDAEVGGGVTRGRWTKRSNGTRDKEAQAVLQGQVQHVVKA